MTIPENTLDSGDSKDNRRSLELSQAPVNDTNAGRLRIYDRKEQAEWRETFGMELPAKRKPAKQEEGSSISICDPYQQDQPAGAGLLPERKLREAVRLAEQLTGSTWLKELAKVNQAQSQDTETNQRVPIREAMNVIRAIIARVKGGGAVGEGDLSALCAAFDQLGAAAVQCKAVHNQQELGYIRYVRGLLGSYLNHTVARHEDPLPRMELSELGSTARGSARPVAAMNDMRVDLKDAGALAGATELVGVSSPQLPRVDLDVAGAVAHSPGQTSPRVALNEETGRLITGSLAAEKPGASFRLSNPEETGVLISQREKAARSLT
jgi:hypothetical protein